MLYPTLSQPTVFFCLLAAGVLGGVASELSSFFGRKNLVLLHCLQFFSTVLCFFIFHFVNLQVNYGELRFYAVVAFLLGILIERLIYANFIAKLLKKLYNFFNGRKKAKKDS